MTELIRRSFLKLTGSLFASVLSSGAATALSGNRIVVPTALTKPDDLIGGLNLDGLTETNELRSSQVQPIVTFHGDLGCDSVVSSVWFDIRDFHLHGHLYQPYEGVTHRRVEFYRDGLPFRITDYNARAKKHGYRVTYARGAELLGTKEQTELRRKYCKQQIAEHAGIGGHPAACVIRIPPIYIESLRIAPESWYFCHRQVANCWKNNVPDGDEYRWNLNDSSRHVLVNGVWSVRPVHDSSWLRTSYKDGLPINKGKMEYGAVNTTGEQIRYAVDNMEAFTPGQPRKVTLE